MEERGEMDGMNEMGEVGEKNKVDKGGADKGGETDEG